MRSSLKSFLRNRVAALWLGLFFVLGFIDPAIAGPVVVSGSSYSMFIQGEKSGAPTLMSTVFDGLTQDFSRAGLTLSLTEFETDLGGGSTLITLQIRANGDLFPTLAEGGIVGLATNGDGLDLAHAVRLTDARIQFFDASAINLFTSNNLAVDYAPSFHLEPWDGFFAFPGDAFIIGNAGGAGVQGVSLQFTVSDVNAVDEPSQLASVVLALAGAMWAGRRRSRSRSRPPA